MDALSLAVVNKEHQLESNCVCLAVYDVRTGRELARDRVMFPQLGVHNPHHHTNRAIW